VVITEDVIQGNSDAIKIYEPSKGMKPAVGT